MICSVDHQSHNTKLKINQKWNWKNVIYERSFKAVFFKYWSKYIDQLNATILDFYENFVCNWEKVIAMYRTTFLHKFFR